MFDIEVKHESLNNLKHDKMSAIKPEINCKKLFLFVTALDQTLIAKPNFELSENCWKSLPKFSLASGVYMQNLSETFVYDHLSELISDGKYSFLRKNTSEFYKLLNNLGNISLASIFWQELNLLRRFGYYYRHTLAVASLIAKFGIDMKMTKAELDIFLQAALIHDIGISRLPHSILFSSQQFKEDEEILMQQHPLASYLLFGYYGQGKNKMIGKGILCHHCPQEIIKSMDRKTGVNAHDISWLLFNMDVFDALISNRPFRPAFSIENALDHLTKMNQTFSMPLDIVHWLEKRLKTPTMSRLDTNLVPIKPTIDENQLN